MLTPLPSDRPTVGDTADLTEADACGARTRRCAVLGSPIAHSLSPVLHHAAYDELGLDWSYEAVRVTEDGLAAYLDSRDATWRGLSLTMPLKRAVVPLLDDLSERAAQAGAVNTVLFEDGRRHGHNTDVPGASAAVRERYDGPLRSAVVIGGGATAASLLLALADQGCARAVLAVRDPARAGETLAAVRRHPTPPSVSVVALGGPGMREEADGMADILAAPDLVASTIPAAAQDDRVLRLAGPARVVFEVVYDPWPTPLADQARRTGKVLVGGLDLLVHQAALQVQLMTGTTTAPLAAMRAAGEAALADRRR